MTVGPVHRQTHRNALGFGQQATLDPAFAAVSGVGAKRPRPGAIWSAAYSSQLQSSPFSSCSRGEGTNQNSGRAQDAIGAGGHRWGITHRPRARRRPNLRNAA